jgi:hypothetical protein
LNSGINPFISVVMIHSVLTRFHLLNVPSLFNTTTLGTKLSAYGTSSTGNREVPQSNSGPTFSHFFPLSSSVESLVQTHSLLSSELAFGKSNKHVCLLRMAYK